METSVFWSSLIDIYIAMYDGILVYFFTFSILNTTKMVQHHAFVIVVRCKNIF